MADPQGPLSGEPSGPFTPDQVQQKSRYELSNGHRVYCAPTGGRGAGGTRAGTIAITSDPDADEAGVETGYQLGDKTVRAPDISVGNVPNKPGWVAGAPPLAVEYADTGQDEGDLKKKINELLAAGTRFIWVVRLVGPRRVDVYEAGKAMRSVAAGQFLAAPGILRNEVPVTALFESGAAFKVALRNLAQREGYESFEAALANSQNHGSILTLLQVLDARGVALTEAERSRIVACRDPDELARWARHGATAKSANDVFA